MSQELVQPYNDGKELLNGIHGGTDYIRLSPSQLGKFFTKRHEWIRETVLGEEKAFQGSTSTELGNVIHALLENTAKKTMPDDINGAVDKYIDAIEDLTIDKEEIRREWFNMGALAVKEFVLDEADDFVVEAEGQSHIKLADDVYIFGTYDALVKDKATGGLCVRDYKTAGTKPSKGWTYDYKMQAQAYAYMLTEEGKNITSIELAYIIRPTKTLPARVFTFREPYTSTTHNYIGNNLKLITETVEAFKKYPELRHVIAQDYRLKEIPKTDFPT